MTQQFSTHSSRTTYKGLRRGLEVQTPNGPAVVQSIHKYGKGPWRVRVTNIKEQYQEGFEVSQIKWKRERPPKKKAKPRRGRPRRVAKKKRFISGCYVVGRKRIRRRKMNRRNPTRLRQSYVLTAQKPGGPRLKFIGNSKFAAKGRAVLFKYEGDARAAAWIMRDSFPEQLRGYKLTPHPDI